MVRTGLERWIAEGPVCAGLPRAKRYGLLAHPASVDGAARHALEALGGAAHMPVRLFAPEHGLWGHEQDMERVEDAVDAATGLPVVSLYGADPASLRPAPETLDDLDTIVIDLQDVGSRYYTFIYTMAHVMEAARVAGLPVVVLDRPNPIGGTAVEGPVLEPGWESFVGRYPLPVRHGMTAGELARFFNDGLGIGADLRVVEMSGWRRTMRFEDTGLPWVPPSPNMPAPSTARVYPGGCLIEGTDLSEGRGTTLPFEFVGVPGVDARVWVLRLRESAPPGVVFRRASFRPMFQKHAGRPCDGVHVIVTDPERFRPFECYVTLLAIARDVDGERWGWRLSAYEFETDRAAIDLLFGNAWMREGLETGAAVAELRERWMPGLERFLERRRDYLIYR